MSETEYRTDNYSVDAKTEDISVLWAFLAAATKPCRLWSFSPEPHDLSDCPECHGSRTIPLLPELRRDCGGCTGCTEEWNDNPRYCNGLGYIVNEDTDTLLQAMLRIGIKLKLMPTDGDYTLPWMCGEYDRENLPLPRTGETPADAVVTFAVQAVQAMEE